MFSVCRNHKLMLSSCMTYIYNKNNTTGVTRGAGMYYPSRDHEFTPGFCLGSCCSIFIALAINTWFRKCKFCWKIYSINLVSFQALTTVRMMFELRVTLLLQLVEVELLLHRGTPAFTAVFFGVVLCRQLFIQLSFSIDQCLVWPSIYYMYVQWTMNYVNKISGP